MKKNKTYVLYLVFFCNLIGCKNDVGKRAAHTYIKYSKEGRYIIKESYDSAGKIESKQYFNTDTIPDGANIKYYPNGIISLWEWYNAKHENPYTGVFYNKEGIFDSLKGDVFLDLICCNNDNNVDVLVISPPQTGIRLLYKDIYKDRVVKSVTHRPILTDSASWFILNEYRYQEDHKYKLYFYVVDTIKRILFYQDSVEIKGETKKDFMYRREH